MSPRKKKETPAEPLQEAPEAAATDAHVDAPQEIHADEILTHAPEPVDLGDAAAVTIEQMIAFHLEGQRYGLPIESVQEIQQIVALSQQSGTGVVVGMVNLRGEVIPAIDMRALVGLPHKEYHVNTPMIICRTPGGLVALIVDEVEDVITLPLDSLAPPPKLHTLADRMVGVCRLGSELVYLLSVEKLVAPLGLTGGDA